VKFPCRLRSVDQKIPSPWKRKRGGHAKNWAGGGKSHPEGASLLKPPRWKNEASDTKRGRGGVEKKMNLGRVPGRQRNRKVDF